jgi:hypothetical protein
MQPATRPPIVGRRVPNRTVTPPETSAAFVKSANNKNIGEKRHKLALEADQFYYRF